MSVLAERINLLKQIVAVGWATDRTDDEVLNDLVAVGFRRNGLVPQLMQLYFNKLNVAYVAHCDEHNATCPVAFIHM